MPVVNLAEDRRVDLQSTSEVEVRSPLLDSRRFLEREPDALEGQPHLQEMESQNQLRLESLRQRDSLPPLLFVPWLRLAQNPCSACASLSAESPVAGHLPACCRRFLCSKASSHGESDTLPEVMARCQRDLRRSVASFLCHLATNALPSRETRSDRSSRRA